MKFIDRSFFDWQKCWTQYIKSHGEYYEEDSIKQWLNLLTIKKFNFHYTMAITRQWPVNSNKGMVFTVLSVPRCYKQDKLGVELS
jgi:hypothetical protein